MENRIRTLLTNYMENVAGVLAAVVTDRINISNIIVKAGDTAEMELILSFLNKNNVLQQNTHGEENSYLEITIEDNKKYAQCSFGKTIITSIADIYITDIELKVYSVHIADKIELIQKGEENVSSEIPGIIRLFSKSERGKLPEGEYPLKIVFIGDSKAGKSSLAKRFVDDDFNDNLTSTVGFNITKKLMKISENTYINYVIWDTGGFTCRTSPTKEKIYNFADAVFIVIDRTRPDNLKSIKNWYKHINQNSLYEIPILIVGTKIDLVEIPHITDFEIEVLAKEYNAQYIAVSAKSGENIKETYVEIANIIIENVNEQRKLVKCETSDHYSKYRINPREIKALLDLEQNILENPNTMIYKKIAHNLHDLRTKGFPKIFEVKDTSFGIKVLNGRVIGLGLFNCGIITLPNSFYYLKSLKTLNLRCNPLSSFPKEILHLKSLEKLDLALTGLMIIPEHVNNLDNLKTIHLENNILSTLPDSFGELKSLKKIYLDHNPIKSFPETFSQLVSLEKISAEAPHFFFRASLSELPVFFGNLKNLKYLDLNSHDLSLLPDTFGSLKSLRYLNLYNNQLKDLPLSFGNLKKLEILDLEKNSLSYLPDSLGDLTELKVVNLMNNQLIKEASKKFKALAFKTSGKEYDRLMKLSEDCKKKEDIEYKGVKKPKKRRVINILSTLGYATTIACIGLITFALFVDMATHPSFAPLLWVIFSFALIINLFIGSSIIPTISSYVKISVFMFQKRIYKFFDFMVVVFLIWSIRSIIKTGLTVEIIPAVNFFFEYTIPNWVFDAWVQLGYNLQLTFLENLDIFLGHFVLKLFSTGLVFWALYRNGFGHIKKTAFDEKEKKNQWPFLILGLIGAFSLAIMGYSTLAEFLKVSYSIGVCIGACVFIYVKNNENLRFLMIYIFQVCSGIIVVWLLSFWSMLASLLIGILFIITFIIIRWRIQK